MIVVKCTIVNFKITSVTETVDVAVTLNKNRIGKKAS